VNVNLTATRRCASSNINGLMGASAQQGGVEGAKVADVVPVEALVMITFRTAGALHAPRV